MYSPSILGCLPLFYAKWKQQWNRATTKNKATMALATATTTQQQQKSDERRKIKSHTHTSDQSYAKLKRECCEQQRQTNAVSFSRMYGVQYIKYYPRWNSLKFAFNQKHSSHYHIGSMGFMWLLRSTFVFILDFIAGFAFLFFFYCHFRDVCYFVTKWCACACACM